MKYKKGNISAESIILVVALFAFILIALVAFKALSPVFSSLETEEKYGNESRQLVANFSPKFPVVLDDLALILLIVFWIGSIALTFLLDTHPVFFGISMLLFIAVLVAVGALQGSLEKTLETGFSDVESSFPKIFWIAQNLLMIVIAFAITVGVALYAKFARR